MKELILNNLDIAMLLFALLVLTIAMVRTLTKRKYSHREFLLTVTKIKNQKANNGLDGKSLVKDETESHAPKRVNYFLARSKEVNPVFSQRTFIQKAKEIFTEIVENIHKKDTKKIERLLSPQLLTEIETYIKEHENLKEIKIERFDFSEIVDADVDNKKIILVCKFITRQKVPNGKNEEFIRVDKWSFSKPLNSLNEDWKVIET